MTYVEHTNGFLFEEILKNEVSPSDRTSVIITNFMTVPLLQVLREPRYPIPRPQCTRKTRDTKTTITICEKSLEYNVYWEFRTKDKGKMKIIQINNCK